MNLLMVALVAGEGVQLKYENLIPEVDICRYR